ncbi:MAG: UDP-N-acetylglucosamine 2-epimerase (non-hydrolyzing) [Dehalococcoidia bacterium]|nr:UDP-N-acetylglucosamine 2-epimerase (non-hydrolyzing) [Dehalococcoidia bacterium]
MTIELFDPQWHTARHKLLSVCGARPNFMKVAPIAHALENDAPYWEGLGGMAHALVHTGQHYDFNMSDVFFQDLHLPRPDVHLDVGSGTHAGQTALIMSRLDPVLDELQPTLVIVVGDVNSTLAAALTAVKRGIRVAHIEAGLRSFDRTMPEEINRLATDAISDYLFTPSPDADENLLREGATSAHIFRVGNVMIDSLVQCLLASERSPILDRLGLHGTEESVKHYVLVTLHRPGNVDVAKRLGPVVDSLVALSQETTIVWPVHPRARVRLDAFGLGERLKACGDRFVVTDPLGYVDFLALERSAALVITDSGGIQEETTYLNVPCLTVRENTERPITIMHGTNALVAAESSAIYEAARRAVVKSRDARPPIPLWDGHAGERTVARLRALLRHTPSSALQHT